MRPSPRRYGVPLGPALPYTLTLAAVLTGCADDRGDADGRPTAPAASRPAPRTTAAGDLCARLVTHWARVVLDGGAQAGLDYQAMGLSGGQYDILRAVVDAARAEEKAHGPAAAGRLIVQQADRRCADRHRDGGPTGGPWQ
ncbi:hypothetical protein ACIO1C_09090 [Streptomyces sp. NPDC087420]|uniref:hypothetical protein n=1 Tax=Streptomyces sp. NPDC087420 TaxID=3365785 RepID=UPI003837D6FC